MVVILTGIGVLLICVTILDIFETLFDPEGQGKLTDAVSWALWKSTKALPTSLLAYAGPLVYVSVIATWALMLVSGWAFIYWPQLPDAFVVDDGIGLEDARGFVTAFYVSLTTISTLGYGDITPVPSWLRIVGPIQSLLGFLLLTAAISWILAIYQDIELRRSLAHETTLLKDALEETGIEFRSLDSRTIERLIDEVTSRLVLVSGSLSQFPITYFFRISDDRQSLAVMSLFLLEISEDLEDQELPREISLHSRMLTGALDHFAETLANGFVSVESGATTRDILRAYAGDHRRSLDDSPEE